MQMGVFNYGGWVCKWGCRSGDGCANGEGGSVNGGAFNWGEWVCKWGSGHLRGWVCKWRGGCANGEGGCANGGAFNWGGWACKWGCGHLRGWVCKWKGCEHEGGTCELLLVQGRGIHVFGCARRWVCTRIFALGCFEGRGVAERVAVGVQMGVQMGCDRCRCGQAVARMRVQMGVQRWVQMERERGVAAMFWRARAEF